MEIESERINQMLNLTINVENTPLADKDWEKSIPEGRISEIDQMIRQKTGKGSDFLGWVEWPNIYDRLEYKEMMASAKALQDEIDVLLVIGIGGSYLGTRAADDMISGLYPNRKVEPIYVGNTMSSTYVAQVQAYLKNRRFGICVVSKSGTTTEPGLAFRIFEQQLWDQVGQKARNLIVAVTDKAKGALKTLADQKHYQTFTIPDDIGGRFSVLTPVGLYPLMVLGVDTDEIMLGAQKALLEMRDPSLITNPAYRYAAARYLLTTRYDYLSETLVSYDIQMQYFNEWWKQLFGESEGKDGQGLLPTSMIFSTDLHSLGQWVQDGRKGILFETILRFNEPALDITIKKDPDNFDQLNYLAGKTLNEVNNVAIQGVVEAHAGIGKIPNILIDLNGKMDAQSFGYLVYFFELAVAMSGYLLEVNPFNQPGVEIYKKNMFRLLGKPGSQN